MHADRRLPVFDSSERNDGTPRRNEESAFAFLNRVAGEFWDYPRGLIEQWASQIEDTAAYKEVRARLRNKDDRQHTGALHELFIHESLQRAGYNVTVHPKLRRSSRQPDFWVEGRGDSFFVECIVPAKSDLNAAAKARYNRFVDGVNKVMSPNFRLSLRRLTQGPTDARAARLRTELERWLRTLDPDTVDDLSDAPTYSWVDEGWSALFAAMPLMPSARGKPGRAIALFAHEPLTSFDGAALIRKGLDRKLSAYGELDHPFLIAVGTDFHDRDRARSLDAFWGDHTAISEVQLRQTEDQTGHGYFGWPGDWKHRSLSGALIVNRFRPPALRQTEVTLWVHPAAERPLPELALPGVAVTLEGNELAFRRAEPSVVEFFGFPAPWPPIEPWTTPPVPARE